MTFSSEVRVWTEKVHSKSRQVFLGTANGVLLSVQKGSPITGAPGQPVDEGALIASWQLTFESPTLALVATNLVYAPNVEDGIGSQGQAVVYGPGGHGRSTVGGSHSVKLTRLGFERIVESETAKVAAT